MQASSTPFILSSATLGRAWWSTPIKMTAWLVVLAYLAAWPVAAFQAHTQSNYYFHPDAWQIFVHQIGLLTPLWWAFLLAIVGFLFGEIGVHIIESRTKKALGFALLDDTHWLTQRVHRLADQLNLPRPRVGYMNQVNAFAVGTSKNNALVVLGAPLVNGLKPDELDAVIGHELGHIASGDMRGMVFADGYQNMFSTIFAIVGTVVMIGLTALARSGRANVNAIGATQAIGKAGRMMFGFGSEVLQKGLSRKREYYADAVGAALSSPDAMSRALQRLGSLSAKPSTAESQYACLMFRGSGGDLMSTHPTTESRVSAIRSGAYLERMAASRQSKNDLQERLRAATHNISKTAIEASSRLRSLIAREKNGPAANPPSSQAPIEN